MLNQNLQSKVYQINEEIVNPIAEGSTSIFYNLSWDVLYKYQKDHPYKLKLTPYNDNYKPVEIYNTTGFWKSPQDVWYKKIELIHISENEQPINELAGVITWQSQEVTNNSVGIQSSTTTLAKHLDYYLKNTKTVFLTISGGEQLDTKLAELGSQGIYEYYDIQYCLEDVTIQDTEKNKIIFGTTAIQAAPFWVQNVPLGYNQSIIKGDNVRVDVYLRYWVNTPGVRL